MFHPLSKEEARAIAQEKIPDYADAFMAEDKFGGSPFYLNSGKAVLSLSFRPEQKMIWITGVVGTGIEWLYSLRQFGLALGYEWAGFKVRRGTRWAKTMAKFSKAQLMASDETGDEYLASLKAR